MLSKEEFGLIIFSIAVLFIIMAFGILIVLVFQRKKNQMMQKQLKLQFEFENGKIALYQELLEQIANYTVSFIETYKQAAVVIISYIPSANLS